MEKFRKKPVVIEAIQFTKETRNKILRRVGAPSGYGRVNGQLVLKIHTLEGVMTASLGDWIIKGVNDEFYPCKPDIFEKTYEKVKTEDISKIVHNFVLHK